MALLGALQDFCCPRFFSSALYQGGGEKGKVGRRLLKSSHVCSFTSTAFHPYNHDYLWPVPSASGEGRLDPGCTRPIDTSYSFFHQTGQNITLTCPKECSNDGTWWYHTHDHGALIAVQRGPQLELPFITPPEASVVGYFCCACADKYPTKDSCCFGVGCKSCLLSYLC